MIRIENTREFWGRVAHILRQSHNGYDAYTEISDAITAHDKEQAVKRKADAVLAAFRGIDRQVGEYISVGFDGESKTELIANLNELGWDLTEIEKG